MAQHAREPRMLAFEPVPAILVITTSRVGQWTTFTSVGLNQNSFNLVTGWVCVTTFPTIHIQATVQINEIGQGDPWLTRETGMEREPEDSNSGGAAPATRGLPSSSLGFTNPAPTRKRVQVRPGRREILADVSS